MRKDPAMKSHFYFWFDSGWLTFSRYNSIIIQLGVSNVNFSSLYPPCFSCYETVQMSDLFIAHFLTFNFYCSFQRKTPPLETRCKLFTAKKSVHCERSFWGWINKFWSFSRRQSSSSSVIRRSYERQPLQVAVEYKDHKKFFIEKDFDDCFNNVSNIAPLPLNWIHRYQSRDEKSAEYLQTFEVNSKEKKILQSMGLNATRPSPFVWILLLFSVHISYGKGKYLNQTGFFYKICQEFINIKAKGVHP